MTELQAFQTLVSHLIVRLHSYQGRGFNSPRVLRSLENLPHDLISYSKGFLFCLSLDDSITELRQDDDYLDGLFIQLLSF